MRGLQEFDQCLEARGVTREHRERTVGYVRIFGEPFTPERAEANVVQWRQEGRSARSINARLTALRAFSRFLYRRRFAKTDALLDVTPVNGAVDRRRIRRALTHAEFDALVATCPPKRRLVYLVAAYTGLRSGELTRLTRGDVFLDAPARIVVRAKSAKGRREESVPLPAWLANELSRVALSLEPSDRVLRVPARAAAALANDLRAAGVTLDDGSGRVVDFHALRVTFITWHALAGTPLTVTQQLARHRDPKLTANVYTALGLADLEKATAALPAPTSPPDASPAKQ